MIHANKKCDIEYVSPSGLECFARCPARFFFSKCMRLSSPDSFDLPLIYGKCIHACLYEAYENPDKAKEIFLHFWKQDNPESDASRNIIRACETIDNFHFFHKNTPIYEPLDPPGGVIDSAEKYNDLEAPFLLDFGGVYPVYGKIDRRVRWQGKIWPLDYKTASQLTARVASNFSMCFQTGIYTIAMSVLEGSVLKGMLVELIRVSPKNDEVQVHPLYVQDAWLDSVVSYAKKLMLQIKACNDHQSWPKHVSGCAPYGMFGSHGYKCEYFDLCSMNDWTNGVKFFSQRDWNPLKGVDVKNATKGVA